MQIALKLDWKLRPTPQRERPPQPGLLILTTLAKAKAEFERKPAERGSFLGIALPSVIVPAWNIVLYPQHPSFWNQVSLLSIEPFQFDPRLFPEGAVWTT